MKFLEVANSLAVTVGATGVAVVLGFVVALAAHLSGPLQRRVWLGLAIVVLVLPGFFVAGLWMDWVGFAGAWRIGNGWWVERWLPLICSAGVLALLLWPVTTLLLTGVWDRTDARLLEATPELRGTAAVRHILWPAALGGLAQPAMITAVLAIGNFAVPALFQARVWPAEVWLEFSTRFDATAAFARSWLPGLLLLGLAGGAVWRRVRWPASSGPAAGQLLGQRLGRGLRATVVAGAAVVLILSLGVPLAGAASNSRTWTELAPAFEASWPVGVRSFGYSVATASLVCLVGAAFARWRWPAISAIPFALPGIFVGIVFSLGASLPWLVYVRRSALIMVAALSARYFFIGWMGATHAWRASDPRLMEFARLAGASPWRMWRDVVWPSGGGAIRGAWFVVYLLCLWDVETVILIVPPGGDSLSLMIFNLLHYGHNAQVTALCLMLGGMAAFPLAVAVAARSLWKTRHAVSAALALTGCALVAGCTPPSDATSARLNSRLFERVEVIGSRGTGPGYFNKPRSVAVDADDALFAVDITGRVQKFGPDGRWLFQWQMPETLKGKPKGMATAPGGRIVVVEPHYNRLNVFDPDGTLVTQWGTRGTNAGQLWFPRAAAVNSRGECFVCEYGVVERVQKFRLADGAYLAGIGRAGTGPGEFNRVEGLDVDAAGRLYVADACNHRIQVFDRDGRFLRAHGGPGRGPGEFSYPYDIRIDAAGRQYVCEFGNSRVQVFDAQDRWLETLGGPGAEPSRMNNPWSLCLDSHGNLYVADGGNHRVLKFIRREGVLEAAGRSESDLPPALAGGVGGGRGIAREDLQGARFRRPPR